MRLALLVFCALIAGACSEKDDQRAREQARQTTEQLKHDSQVAVDKAEAGAAKAGKQIDRGLKNAREKVRDALDEHPERKDDKTTR